MPFQPYYSTPIDTYLCYAFLGFLAMELIVAVAVLIHRELTRATVIGGLIAGVIVGLVGGGIYATGAAVDINTPIVRANIEKKYDVQAVTFDFRTTKAGGYGWTPTQSEPQQVIVKVNNVSHVAILTQNAKTAEPTLIEIDTKNDIALRTDDSLKESKAG